MKPASEFADMVLTDGAAQIERENLKAMVAVTARLHNRDLGSTLNEIRRQVQARIHLPQGYQIVYGGAYAEQQHAFKQLLFVLLGVICYKRFVMLHLWRVNLQIFQLI